MAAGVLAASAYMPDATDRVALACELGGLVVLGAVLYLGSNLLLWQLMNRPAGPEAEVRDILRKILSKLRPA